LTTEFPSGGRQPWRKGDHPEDAAVEKWTPQGSVLGLEKRCGKIQREFGVRMSWGCPGFSPMEKIYADSISKQIHICSKKQQCREGLGHRL
jgi:hypothetical protein